MAPQQQPKTLAEYRAEAKREPFVLQVDDTTTISIPAPSGNTLMDLDDVFKARDALKLLAGDQYQALVDAIGEEDGGVLMAVGKDLRKHFGLGG